MRIYWDKLDQLKKTIEAYFAHILEDWDGGLDYFKPLNDITKEIFQ